MSSGGSVWNSKSVESGVERDPDDVDKVPVQHRAFDTKVVTRRKVTQEPADQNAREDQNTDRDVETVQPGQAVEHRSVNTRADIEAFVHDEVGVLVGLSPEKAQAKHDGDDQP